MNIRTLALSSAVLAGVISSAAAQMYTLDTTGGIDDAFTNFDGGDQYPFATLLRGDAFDFHFTYDVSATPDMFLNERARYQLDGAGSHVRMGSITVGFDRIEITTGPFDSGGGGITLSGYADAIGFVARVDLQGPFDPGTTLPTTPYTLSDFTWGYSSYADSDQNQLALPIVLGGVESITIVPAPAVGGLMLGLAALRRRR